MLRGWRPATEDAAAVRGRLVGIAAAAAASALNPATVGGYRTPVRHYLRCCVDAGVDPLPMTEDNLILFAGWMASHRDVSYGTLVGYFTGGLRAAATAWRQPHPLHGRPTLRAVLRGLQRRFGVHGRPKRPVGLRLLRRAFRGFDTANVDERTAWIMCVCAYFAMARVSELTAPSVPAFDTRRHLSVRDAQVYGDHVALFVPSNKTLLAGEGAWAFLGGADAGGPFDVVGLVRAHKQWRLRQTGGRVTEPLFTLAGAAATPDSFWAIARPRLRAAMDADEDYSDYSGLSFRAGAATAAYAMGVPETLIKAMGRWRSDAYRAYTQIPLGMRLRASARLRAHEAADARRHGPLVDGWYQRLT